MTGGFFDPTPDDPEQVTNPFMPTPGQDTSGFFGATPNQLLQQQQTNASNSPVGRVIQAAGVIGKTIQPLAAPQQLIFGGIGSLEDLATGQGAAKAWDTLKQGGTGALDYLTYQRGSDLPGALGQRFTAPTSRPLTGSVLFKKAGAPDWLAKWGGLGADFFLDVPLLGKAAKLGTLGRLDNARIIENAAATFGDPGALQSFAQAIVKSPFSTAPIRQLSAALPAGVRGNIGAKIGDAVETTRWRMGGTDADPAGFTLGELFVSRQGRIPGVPSVQADRLRAGLTPGGTGMPDEIIDLENRARAVNWNIKFRLQDAGTQMEKVAQGLPAADLSRWKEISTRLADVKSPGDRAFWDGKLRQLATDVGNPQLYTDATTALQRGMSADVYAATQLEGVGLMSATDLAAYSAGDKSHLRRIFGYYDNPVQHSERLERRGLPASVQFEDQQLTHAFGRAIVRQGNTVGNPAQYAQDLKAAWTDPKVLPADALTGFLKGKGWTDQDVLDTVSDIAGEWRAKAGIQYQVDDVAFARAMRKKAAEDSSGGGATRAGMELAGNPGTIQQRTDLQDYQRLALSEVQDYAKLADEQASKVGKLVQVRTVVKGYEDYLKREGLIFDDIGPNSVQNTGGWRYVTTQAAKNLDTPDLAGKYIPAIFHRRLMETQTVRDPGVIGAAWQWTGAKFQQFKLANPGSIATNLGSGFVMAERAGVNPAALTQGLADYARLVRGANKGDGVLDDAFKIGGVSMREMMEHGEFLDATFTRAEVAGRLSNMERILMNPAGSPIQRAAAGISDFLQGNAAAAQAIRATGDVATLGSRHAIALLSNTYGQVDAVMKGGIYMASRRGGLAPMAAAKRADDILFNYENVPYAIDYLRRGGLLGIPFASFQLLSSGRFLRTLYENPYAVDKYYRTAARGTDDQTPEDQQRLDAASPDYVRKSLYVYGGRDKNGDARYFNLASVLPESGVFDAFDADGVSKAVPPAVQLFSQWWTGKGYQGRSVYNGGGSFSDTAGLSPEEAARGTLKLAWQFGAVPWAPGQPMTERLAKSLANQWVKPEDIPDPKVQAVLKFLSSGPAAPLEGPATPKTMGGQEPQPPVEAALRYLGIKSVPVQDTLSKPGTGRYRLTDYEQQISMIDQQMGSDLKRATSDQQRQNIRAEYAAKRQPIIDEMRQVRSSFR